MHRLPVNRVAVTVPPAAWFHGISRAIFCIYRQALVDLGMTVFDVPVDAFIPPDTVRIAALIRELKAFRPDLAFGLSHGSYALICRLPARRDGSRPNLFTEILEIPTICLWDHAPVELADQLLTPHPADPAASSPGALETLRRTLTGPYLIHWSRDSGQTQLMKELGFVRQNHVIHEMAPALPGFTPQDIPAIDAGGKGPKIGFIGHFYQDAANHPHPDLSTLASEAIQIWVDSRGRSLWSVLAHLIGRMPVDLRRQFALDADQTYFWRFAHRLIVHQAQTSLRMKLLGSVNVPVACYGNLKIDAGELPANLRPLPGGIPFGPSLAAALARHPVTIDVLNPGFIHGYSHKPILGFAAGGFMLIDRKQDFIDAFGKAGEAVCYDGPDDLGAKVDQFLSDPKYRFEVGAAIRETITARFQLKDVLARVLQAAVQCADTAGLGPVSTRQFPIDRQSVPVANLLPEIRCYRRWSGARVKQGDSGALITTPPRAWDWAAEIAIPSIAQDLNEPHLRVTIIVEEGRFGIFPFLVDKQSELEEQLISPTSEPFHVIVELPREEAVTVILRNTIEGASRARVLDASLCDRTAGG